MTTQYRLAERAVLMRLSAGLPGKNRTDKSLTEQVKGEHNLGKKSGNWVKKKYPDWALEPIEKLVGEARAYHAAVTLPFDSGIGILSAALIMEYGDRMREFKGKFENLRDSHFKARYHEMVEWAKVEHNGTFDASDYPDVEEVCESFYFRTEPLPVPDAQHFEGTLSSLLGVDAQSVDIRVQDAMQEAKRELMRRLIDPVKAMAVKLAEQPKEGKDCPIFRDSLVENVRNIAKLATKLNISGDPAIDGFAKEVETYLVCNKAETLRENKFKRDQTAATAAAIVKKLEGYKI